MAANTGNMTVYRKGKPIMMDYDAGSNTYSAGDVVLIGPTPVIFHTADPAYTGATTRDAVAVGGGIYECVTDGTGAVGDEVFWDATNKKITATAAGNTHFGIMVAGPTFLASGANPAADNDLCWVLHRPRGIAVGASEGSFAEVTQSATGTIAAATFQKGFLNSAPAGAITLTTDTAAALVAQFRGCKVGDRFRLLIENTSAGANTITFAAGTGVTYRGETSIAQNKALILEGVFTNVTASSEAVTMYGVTGA